MERVVVRVRIRVIGGWGAGGCLWQVRLGLWQLVERLLRLEQLFLGWQVWGQLELVRREVQRWLVWMLEGRWRVLFSVWDGQERAGGMGVARRGGRLSLDRRMAGVWVIVGVRVARGYC